MSISLLQTLDVIEVMENFIQRERPPEELRDKVDLSFKIEGQSVIVYEIRAHFLKPGQFIESNIAKATFVKAKMCWKIFWQRANLKWESYKPAPEVSTLKDFVEIIKADTHSCFWG
jgi:hypothetical protein